MAAVLGMDDAVVIEACAEAAQGEVVEAANFNSPGQIVIAGKKTAVERALEVLKSKGAKRAIVLPVSVPSHTSLMRPAERLQGVDIKPPAVKIFSVDLRVHDSADGIRQALIEQLIKPVRWTATVKAILENGAKRIVECGPGKVLTGLNRRIERSKDIAMLAIDDPASISDALKTTQE